MATITRSAAEVQEFAELRRLVEAGRRVVVHSQDVTPDTAVRCIRLDAASYVSEAQGEVHLVAAVGAAATGLPYMLPAISGAI